MSTRRTKTLRRKEDREYIRGINEILKEFANSDTHKTFYTVEELFVALDSDDKT